MVRELLVSDRTESGTVMRTRVRDEAFRIRLRTTACGGVRHPATVAKSAVTSTYLRLVSCVTLKAFCWYMRSSRQEYKSCDRQ